MSSQVNEQLILDLKGLDLSCDDGFPAYRMRNHPLSLNLNNNPSLLNLSNYSYFWFILDVVLIFNFF